MYTLIQPPRLQADTKYLPGISFKGNLDALDGSLHLRTTRRPWFYVDRGRLDLPAAKRGDLRPVDHPYQGPLLLRPFGRLCLTKLPSAVLITPAAAQGRLGQQQPGRLPHPGGRRCRTARGAQGGAGRGDARGELR
eukprot:9476641-Pyramimonas_sp.AAC.2